MPSTWNTKCTPLSLNKQQAPSDGTSLFESDTYIIRGSVKPTHLLRM